MLLEEQIVRKFQKEGWTLTTVESCTGGKVSAEIVNVPGASDVLMQGLVTYSNEAKMHYVGVREETLTAYGAVSEETAREMCEGAVKLTGTDAAVSTTGIAGPGGGTPEKPVGLVYIGATLHGHTEIRKLNIDGDRQAVRDAACEEALKLLLSVIS